MAEENPLGKLVRSLRNRRGWTQEQLATMTSLSPRTIQRIERGEVMPTDETLLSLAAVFDIDVNQLKLCAEQSQWSEEQVRKFLDDFQKIDFLPLIQSGRHLMQIAGGAELGTYGYSPLENNEEAELVGGFLQDVRDWGDIWIELNMIERARAEVELNERIEELARNGYWLFGQRKKKKLLFPHTSNPSVWTIRYLYIVQKDDPSILKTEEGELILPIKIDDSSYSIEGF